MTKSFYDSFGNVLYSSKSTIFLLYLCLKVYTVRVLAITGTSLLVIYSRIKRRRVPF
jgi:hypothetical protein